MTPCFLQNRIIGQGNWEMPTEAGGAVEGSVESAVDATLQHPPPFTVIELREPPI